MKHRELKLSCRFSFTRNGPRVRMSIILNILSYRPFNETGKSRKKGEGLVLSPQLGFVNVGGFVLRCSTVQGREKKFAHKYTFTYTLLHKLCLFPIKLFFRFYRAREHVYQTGEPCPPIKSFEYTNTAIMSG